MVAPDAAQNSAEAITSMNNGGNTRVRPAAVAGQFYPADPNQLRQCVQDLLLEAPAQPGPGPKALLAPHAGYLYSGPIAASAYVCWQPDASQIKRVVVLGPSHFVPCRGLAGSDAEAFATPLGEVPIDRDAIEELKRFPQFTISDTAHSREHAVEVQLPFLQVVLPEFRLVPLVVGDATAEEVAGLMDVLWGGDETRFVISSDLSHYLDSETARTLDQLTARAIEELAPETIREGQACGRLPIQGLLRAASAHGLRPQTVDLRNSGDTAGPRDRVVGYGAFAFRS